jgi:L-aminoadipate-semialdehyde dehydrogenase
LDFESKFDGFSSLWHNVFFPKNMTLDRWKTHLSQLTELILPTDYPRQIPPRIVEAEYLQEIQEATSLSILQLSLHQKTTPFSVLLAAFSVLLHRYTGEDDITLGSSSHSNPLVLRMNIQSSHSFSQVLNTVIKVIISYLDRTRCIGRRNTV